MHDEHIHDHLHTHGDGHTHHHPHTHGDGQAHTHPENTAYMADLKQTKALLEYMIHHNQHHAEELADLLDTLPEKPQKKLLSAIGVFEAANVELQGVLDCLD